MQRVSYTNDRWLTRTARTLPVVAIAALTGGAVGGFSVYAIILALTEAPNMDTAAMKTAAVQSADIRPQNAPTPIRTIGTPPPNVTEPPTSPGQPPVQQSAPVSQIDVSQTPAPQNQVPQNPVSQNPAPWPDALSRAHPTPPQPAATAENRAPVSAPPAGSDSVAAAQSKPVPPKPVPQKRRVVSRKPLPAPNQGNSEMAARSQPVYDYYSNNNYNRYSDNYGDNRYGDATPAPRGRIVVRRQSRDGYYQTDARLPPPQPAAPGFFGGGFFGGGDRYGWR
jgi:hypothetical protein